MTALDWLFKPILKLSDFAVVENYNVKCSIKKIKINWKTVYIVRKSYLYSSFKKFIKILLINKK